MTGPLDLWPDFDEFGDVKSPKAVIDEAGKGLTVKTGGKLRFLSGPADIGEDNQVRLRFGLYVPNLRYSYPFMQVRFDIKQMYPVTLVRTGHEEVAAYD